MFIIRRKPCIRKKLRNDEEEATLCVTLLKAYSATIYDRGDKGEKVQILLDRSWEVLNKISDSLLKCQLLVVCYGETSDGELAKEARAIMNGWGDSLTVEQQELLNEFIP